MRLWGLTSTCGQVLERGAVWGTLGELYRSYFLEMLYILQLWFSAWRTVILRGDLGSPRAL